MEGCVFLFPRSAWERRRDAQRPKGFQVPRSRYRIHEDHLSHFLTCSIVNWLPIFARPPVAQIILNSWRFLQEHHRIEIYAYVDDPTHWRYSSARDYVGQPGLLEVSLAW